VGYTGRCACDAVQIAVTGVVKCNEHVAESGNMLTWGLCPECGTQIFAYSSARPELRVIRLGALNQPHGLVPQSVIWTAQAPEWAAWHESMDQHAGQPPAPVAKD
jgi:hypothetical protein